MRSIQIPELDDLDGVPARDLEALPRNLDRARRQLDASIAETVGAAERTSAYVEDGHASVHGWVKAACNWSRGEARAITQTARLLHAVPEVRTAAHAGTLGVPQARLLARVHGNQRCADQLPASAGLLVGHAAGLWFEEFAVVVRRWEHLADADGAHRAHERAHERRDAHINVVDEHVYVDAHGGIVAAAMLEEIFDRFCDAQFRADWDAGIQRWGDHMVPALLDRSDAQRRFDALVAVFTAAASSGTVGTFDPLVNVIVDQTTFEHHLATLAGAHNQPLDPAMVDDRRCENSDRAPTRPRRHACRGPHRPRPARRTRHGRRGHRPRPPQPTVHRQRPPRRPARRPMVFLARMRHPLRALSDRPHQTVGPRPPHQHPQRRPRLRTAQPMETTRLPHLARPNRPLAHPPTRRHRDRMPERARVERHRRRRMATMPSGSSSTGQWSSISTPPTRAERTGGSI